MSQNTPIAALPWPELTDIPNAQSAFKTLAEALDTKVIPKYANPTARDAAQPSPVDGAVCYLTDRGGFQSYRTSGWQPLGAIVCTSSTRPTPVETGRHIFETDTLRTLSYSGSAWVGVGPYKRTQTLSGTAASVLFSSVPSTLRTLRITYTARCDTATTAVAINLRVNADSGGNYYYNFQSQANTTITPAVSATQNKGRIGAIPAASAGAGVFGAGRAEVAGWDAPHNKLGWTFHSHFYDTSPNSILDLGGGWYNANGPYTSLTLLPDSGNFVSGSEFVLEGWD